MNPRCEFQIIFSHKNRLSVHATRTPPFGHHNIVEKRLSLGSGQFVYGACADPSKTPGKSVVVLWSTFHNMKEIVQVIIQL